MQEGHKSRVRYALPLMNRRSSDLSIFLSKHCKVVFFMFLGTTSLVCKSKDEALDVKIPKAGKFREPEELRGESWEFLGPRNNESYGRRKARNETSMCVH